MSRQINRRNTIFGGSTLAATSFLAGEAPSSAQAAELNSQPLSPSPGWARALPPGPDTRVKITEAYAKLVARDAYFWAWPLVNIFNRRQAFKDVTEIVMAGPVPTAPLNHFAMLTDYITPDQRLVACPNQDVVYGAGSLALDITPVVIQVPNFGERFWVYQVVDLRTDGVVQLGKMYGTTPSASTWWSARTGMARYRRVSPRYSARRRAPGSLRRAFFRMTPRKQARYSVCTATGGDVSAGRVRRHDEDQGLE